MTARLGQRHHYGPAHPMRTPGYKRDNALQFHRAERSPPDEIGKCVAPTTVLPVLSHDPKHGRWILPVIIVAMVLLTYTFVNGIEPASSPTGEPDPGEDPAFSTTPTSSTTTFPPEVAAFMVTLDIFENQLEQYGTAVVDINAAWDSREVLFGDTRQALDDLRLQLKQWENDIAAVTGVPSGFGEGHVALVVEVSDLPLKVDDIILGLEAPDDGTMRRAATAEYSVEVQEVGDAITALREIASGRAADTEETTEETTGDTTATDA